jgi:hypothetical protein
MELWFLTAAAVAGVGLFGVIAWRERNPESLQTVELRFDGNVTTSAVEALVGSIAGLPGRAVVVIDVAASETGLRHLLHAPQQTLDTLRSQWRGLLPGLRMSEPAQLPAPVYVLGARVRLSGRYAVIRSDRAAEATAGLLGSLQPLSAGEGVLLRWWLRAGGRPSLPGPERERQRDGLASWLWREPVLPGSHVRALHVKYAGPVVAGVGLVAVAAGHHKRAAHLLSRAVSPLRARGAATGRLLVRRVSARRLPGFLDAGWRRGSGLFSPSELAAVVGIPIEGPLLPGLALGTAPVLMPSPRIPRTGRVLAVSNWPGTDSVLAQPVLGGLSHTLIVGPSGVGKSSLIGLLAVQDLQAGRGLLLVDGKGDLAGDVLARVPAGREVVVLDPGAGGRQPGLRLFASGGDPHLTADLILGVLASIAPGEFGPLSARWLRLGLLLLAHSDDATLADLPAVFSHAGYRRRLVARLDDPLARASWAAFEQMSAAERAHQLAAPLNKTDEIIGRRVIRAVVGQSRPRLDLADIFRRNLAVVVSLNPGQIGTPAARLLGALVVHQFFLAVQARSAVAPEARRPAFAYIDEPKILSDVPTPIDSLYELARGLGVGMLTACQSLAQLPPGLRAAATSNSATLIAFRQNAADSRIVSPELPGVSPEQLQHLGAYEVVMRLGLGPGDVTAPVTGRTLAPHAATSDPDEVRRRSAERYGVDPAEVDAALAARYERGGDETPVGVVGRSS